MGRELNGSMEIAFSEVDGSQAEAGPPELIMVLDARKICVL